MKDLYPYFGRKSIIFGCRLASRGVSSSKLPVGTSWSCGCCHFCGWEQRRSQGAAPCGVRRIVSESSYTVQFTDSGALSEQLQSRIR